MTPVRLCHRRQFTYAERQPHRTNPQHTIQLDKFLVKSEAWHKAPQNLHSKKLFNKHGSH